MYKLNVSEKAVLRTMRDIDAGELGVQTTGDELAKHLVPAAAYRGRVRMAVHTLVRYGYLRGTVVVVGPSEQPRYIDLALTDAGRLAAGELE